MVLAFLSCAESKGGSVEPLRHFQPTQSCSQPHLGALARAVLLYSPSPWLPRCCTSWSGPPVSTGQGGVVLHMSRGWGDRTIYSNIIDLCHLLMKVLKTLSSALSGLLCGPNFTEAVVERGPLWPHRGEALPGWPWVRVGLRAAPAAGGLALSSCFPQSPAAAHGAEEPFKQCIIFTSLLLKTALTNTCGDTCGNNLIGAAW